ncbi:MAG: chitobiase/beta-hexosaminidase C-terminal domain-containing protein, partial [bacterium]
MAIMLRLTRRKTCPFPMGYGWGFAGVVAMMVSSCLAAPAFVARSVTNDISSRPLVRLAVTAATETKCFAYEEFLPATVAATNITGGGVWVPEQRAIHWGAFTNTLSVELAYRAVGPAGTYVPGGRLSADGAWAFTPVEIPVTIAAEGGDTNLPVRLGTVAMPVIAPPGSTSLPVAVTMTCVTPGALIRYTTDGTAPNAGSTLYTGAVQVATSMFVRARAFATNSFPSAVRSAWFTQSATNPAMAVTRSVATNIPWAPVVSAVVTQTTAGVCWAFEETLPPGLTASNITENGVFDPTSRVVKWGPFVGRSGATLSYQAAGSAGSYSVSGRWSIDGYSTEGTSTCAVAVAAMPGSDDTYPVRPGILATPVITPPGSTALPMVVTMSCTTTGAVVRYTLDGSVPNEASTLYTGALSVANTTLIRARAFAPNAFPSAVRSAYFSQAAAVPSPQAGCQVVTNTPWMPELRIAVTQAVAGVCWAYELWLPPGLTASNVTETGVFDPTNGVIRWGAFIGRSNAVLSCGLSGRAGAYSLRSRWSVDGYGGETNLVMVTVVGGTNDFGIPARPQSVARPVLNPAGSLLLPVTVSASCSTTGAVLRYTLNGTPPTPQSTLYSTGLNFTAATVLRVRGFKDGCEPSSVAVGNYARTPSNATLFVTRTISANGTPAPAVELQVVPPVGIKCWAVTETIPERLAPYSISHNGSWSETDRTIHWGPFLGADAVRLSYRLTGMPGTYRLTGAGSADGVGNVTTGPDMIDMAAPEFAPDLVPASISFERAIAVTYSVTNSGKGVAMAWSTARWYDTFYLSSDAILDASDTLVGRFIGNEGMPLAAGAGYTASQTLSLPEGAGGNYYLILRTDEREIVYEANEANNVLAVPITVPVLEGTPERSLDMPAEWGGAQPGALDFSHDGVRLAVAAGNRVAVWSLQSADNATNALLGSFSGHTDRVSSVDFSPAGDEILSGGRDGKIRVWDARTFAQARQIAATNGEPTPAVFSADGAMVLGGSARNVARVWDAVTTSNILQTLSGHAGSITAVAFSPDGTKALTGGSDKSAVLWDVTSGAVLYRWTNHAQIVSAVAISPDGARALTACGDGTVRIWSTTTGAAVTELRQGRPVSDAVFSPDGLYVAACDRGLPGQTFLWDVSSGQVLRTYRPFNANPSTVEGVAFSPDRTTIATSHSDGRVRLWDTGLMAVPIHPITVLPIGVDVPVTMRSHGLYYFELDMPAQRSLVVTVDAAIGGSPVGRDRNPVALAAVGRDSDPDLLSTPRFANRSQQTVQKTGMAALALSDFPPESDIEAFRVLATRQHLPSVYEYDHFAQAFVSVLHAEVPLSANTAGKCYVLVFAPWLSAGEIAATVRATFADFHISKVSPSRAGNAGDATLKVEGLGFTPDTIPVLVGLTHSITGQVSMYRNSTLMHATFNLRGVAAETYDLRVEKRGSIPATTEDALTVAVGIGPVLTSRLVAPSAIRPGREYTLYIEYANTGDADMNAPLFVASALKGWQVLYWPQAQMPVGGGPLIFPSWHPPPDNRPRVSLLQVLGLNQDGPPGVLPPGAKCQTQVSFQYDGGDPLMEFKLEALRADATPMNWAELEPKFRPPDMADDLWAALWANFQWQVGSTWADYLRALNDQANLMAQSGGTTFDAATLVGGLFSQAAGSSYRRTLAAEVDAVAPAPTLPLQFSRFCTDGLEHRFTVGPLGRGWSHGFEYNLTHPTNDVIAIRTPGGSRRFTRGSDGVWYGGAGEYASLSSSADGSAVLREKDGTAWQFNAGGQLASVDEPNSNRITLAYSSGRLTTLIHSAGPVFRLQYNAQHRIIRLTDHAGQHTDYEYDGSGERVIRVIAPGGVVTTYAYEPASAGAAAHALASITFPDNTHRYFAHNAQGFLSEESRDGGAERVQYTYDRTGIVTIRDAQNAVTTMRVGPSGQMLQMADPLGRPLTMTYDFDNNLTRLLGPAGDTTEMDYDALGNTKTIVNPAGQQVTMTHTNLSRLASLRDARDQLTGFGYSMAGNLIGITYPDTIAETFGYNTAGGLTTFHNRRGQTIQYTRNTAGQITRKTHPDGRTIDYTYDTRGYLTRVVDSAQGTTSMGYDSRSFMT